MVKTILISPCHPSFGGWFRADNIARRLKGRLICPPRPERLVLRLLRGFLNGVKVLPYSRVYIFELMPETLFPAFFARVLGKRVILDIGDEWLTSPTYLQSGVCKKAFIRLLDKLTVFFPLTVTSEYLVKKFGRGLKLINGVNKDEFKPYDRKKTRKFAMMSPDCKSIVSFGNTMGETRRFWLDETIYYLKKLDPGIDFIELSGYPIKTIAMWLGICDLVLFPTGGNPCEKACFPIRVGTALNAERVIATDDSDTEFHNTLKKYDCLLTGSTPQDLAININRYFNSAGLRKRLNENVLKAKAELDWDKLIKKL